MRGWGWHFSLILLSWDVILLATSAKEDGEKFIVSIVEFVRVNVGGRGIISNGTTKLDLRFFADGRTETSPFNVVNFSVPPNTMLWNYHSMLQNSTVDFLNYLFRANMLFLKNFETTIAINSLFYFILFKEESIVVISLGFIEKIE